MIMEEFATSCKSLFLVALEREFQDGVGACAPCAYIINQAAKKNCERLSFRLTLNMHVDVNKIFHYIKMPVKG